jgi:hypothetical protein
VNYATYKIQTTSYYVEEGESGDDLNNGGGGRKEGAGARHGPGSDQGSGRRGIEAEWRGSGHGVDQAAVGEVPAWTRQLSVRCRRGPDGSGGGRRGGADARVVGEMIVANVRI